MNFSVKNLLYFTRFIKLISFIIYLIFFTSHCTSSSASSLTRQYIQEVINNPSSSSLQLIAGTYQGCESIPARNFIQRKMVGFEFTGETCFITVNDNQTVSVSFIGNNSYPVFPLGRQSDTFVGNINNNEVLIVQHHSGKVVSVTQTQYDNNDNLIYGKSGQGDYIKECLIGQLKSCKR